VKLLAALYNVIFQGRLSDNPGPFDPAQVKKILVVRNDNIGDVICSTPAIVSLRKLFPAARIAALVCTLSQDVLQQHPMLDDLYVYPKAKHRYRGYGRLKSWWILGQTLRAIRRENFDLALSLRSDFSPSLAWLVYASRARWKAGPKAKRGRMGFFYNTPLPWPKTAGHEAQRVLALLAALGLAPEEEKLCIALPRAADDRARRFIREHEVGANPVVVNVGYWPYTPARNWMAENYCELLCFLHQAPLPLVVTHGPGQADWVKENILQRLSFAVPVFYSGHLLDLAALLAHSRLCVTVDGGPMHVAAAAATRLLAFIEAKASPRWYPWKVEHSLIHYENNVNEISPGQVRAALAPGSKAGAWIGL
jgi:ADP-heptose:LPS heptosyltransferase